MAAKVIEIEGPIFEDCLVSRIAEAHGFGRAGAQIRATVTDVIERRFPRSVEDDDGVLRTIYWPEGADAGQLSPFRSGPRDIRDHSDIPLAELASLALRFVSDGAEPAVAAALMAKVFDLGRLRASTRERFEQAARMAGSG